MMPLPSTLGCKWHYAPLTRMGCAGTETQTNTKHERANMIDKIWFEKRRIDESTLDEKTHNAKFHKELVALFKKTAEIRQTRTELSVFPEATQAIDSKPNMVSPTLVLLSILAQKTAQENRTNPRHSYQSWHLEGNPARKAERHGIPFPIFLYNISPFWVPKVVQRENNLDEQRRKLYVEAMQRAKISEILAYLMAAGLSLFYKSSTHLVQKLVLSKANSCLLRFLILARNQRGWINAILKTLDPAGALKLNAQLAENIESMLVWIYSAWINVSGIMITIDHPDPLNQQNNGKNLPGFLFPSQVANLMLVETDDIIPMIALIVWPIFGPMMALRYPTQPLRVAASSPTLSILHFVDPQDDARPPEFQTPVRDFANFQPPMA